MTVKEVYELTRRMLNRNKLKSTGIRVTYLTARDMMTFDEHGEYAVVYFNEKKTKEKFFEYMEKANNRKKLGNTLDVIRKWAKLKGEDIKND